MTTTTTAALTTTCNAKEEARQRDKDLALHQVRHQRPALLPGRAHAVHEYTVRTGSTLFDHFGQAFGIVGTSPAEHRQRQIDRN